MQGFITLSFPLPIITTAILAPSPPEEEVSPNCHHPTTTIIVLVGRARDFPPSTRDRITQSVECSKWDCHKKSDGRRERDVWWSGGGANLCPGKESVTNVSS